MSKRAERRSNKERLKEKACRLFRIGYHPHEGNKVNPRAHHYADNFTMCSGFCCGNPRKWFKDKTLEEERFHADADEQERELFDALFREKSS